MCRLKDNSHIDLRLFPVRLSKWLPMDKLCSITSPFYRSDGKKAYGKTFVIRAKKFSFYGRRVKKYAVFIKERRRTKRVEDVKLKKTNLADYLLMLLPKKKEGISILKSVRGIML